MSTTRKIRLFLAWQDEQEEDWLNEMSAQGFQLNRVVFPGIFYFEQGESSAYVYRLDFKSSSQKDMDEYVQLFADAGWEHVGEFFNGWQYFRKESHPGQELEIYTDVDSKIEKYRRLIGFLVIFLPILIISLNNFSGNGFSLAQTAVFLVLLLYIITFVKLFMRIDDLKKRH